MLKHICIALSVLSLSGFPRTNAQTVAAPNSPGPASIPPALGSAIPAIRINQLGYYPHAPKMAVVISSDSSDQLFYILSADFADSLAYRDVRDTVYTGHLGPLQHSINSSLSTRLADFNAFTKEGRYKIVVPGQIDSYPFSIGPHAAEAPARASLKGFYYQRSAMPLEPAYAGMWSRPSGHPDTAVLIHPSAASEERPAGTIISSSGGWYDAGDYNKYIVNSGITMGTLLSAYEDFPAYYDALRTNIPSIPTLPDILSESLYNLRWMLTMQDPADGGVYNKCTNLGFDGMVMPGITKSPRYVMQKGTAAALDFAAVTAQAARILRKFPTLLPGLADSCLRAATNAWSWALNNPALAYDQGAMNKLYDPKVTTGGYGDKNFNDEWYWAAVELMVSTNVLRDPTSANAAQTARYKKIIEERINDPMTLPSWGDVHALGDYTLLRYSNVLPDEWQTATRTVRRHLLQMADDYRARVPANAFHTVMGGSPGDFVWGSNAVAANQGILLVNAWLQTKDRKYLDNALSNLDYLLGRNATGYCFITGMGTYSPMHPHHRPSVADGIRPPVPGLLVGGPNPGRQDHQHYDLTEPETSYLDQERAYASNEIAINWNAPLVYLAGALEALQYLDGYSQPRQH